jgi:hypothetical protein
LRITLVGPPVNVKYGIQRGATNLEHPDLLAPARVTRDAIVFDLQVRVTGDRSGEPNFLGEFAQGPRDGRFVYVNSGVQAGETNSCWSRRLRIPLTNISWKQLEAVLATPGAALEARVPGMARDGGPSCATVPLIDGGWRKIDTL